MRINNNNFIYKSGYAITCGHIFHGSCISTWMMTNNTCPFCRMKLASYKLIKLNCEVIGVAEDREETLKINNELFTSLSALTKESRNKNAQFIKFE